MPPAPNPRLPSEWKNAVNAQSLNSNSITPFNRTYRSASTLKFEEFLCLKVLWTSKPFLQLKVGDHVVEDVFEEAKSVNFGELRYTVDRVNRQDPHPKARLEDGSLPPPSGLFTTFQYFAHLVTRNGARDGRASPKIARPKRQAPQVKRDDFVSDMASLNLGDSPRTPSPQSSTESEEVGTPYVGEEPPRTEYEATVNMGLITMLCAIRLHFSSLRTGHWLPDPKPFRLCDPSTDTYAMILQARVDGYLSKHGHDGAAFGIVEVKPFDGAPNAW